MANFDRWTILKLIQVIATISCLICKRVTDDEANRLFLVLQKLSREWSLLNNVTWGRVGAAVADTTYGGFIIITSALFIGRLFGELPTERRITEYIFLGIGTILFIILGLASTPVFFLITYLTLGSLEFAALDSVPENLVDNAAIIGTLSLLTAALFLLDLGGPRAKKVSRVEARTKPQEVKATQVYNIEDTMEKKKEEEVKQKNGHLLGAIKLPDANGRYRDSMYKKIKEEKPKSFDIYGKDMHVGSDDETDTVPPSMEEHSPVWSKIKKAQLYATDHSYDRPPSSPGDPGYVQYMSQHWGESGQKTPRQSPTQV